MIKYLVIAALAALGVAILTQVARRQKPAKSSGEGQLGWPLALQVGTALSIPFSAFLVWAATQAQPSQRVMAAMVSGGFGLGSLYLTYSVFLCRVWWTKEALFFWHPLGGTKSLHWAEMEDWRYIGWVQAFRISGKTGWIWYSPMQTGLASLTRVVVKRTKLVPPMPDHEGPDEPP